jgi:hypothetical protein
LPTPVAKVVFLTVYASRICAGKPQYSAGCCSQSRREIPVGQYRNIRYQIVPPLGKFAWLAPWRRDYRLVVATDADVSLPELVVVGRQGRGVPLNRGEGCVLARIEAGTPCGPRRPVVVKFLGPKRPWCGCLFGTDDRMSAWLDIRPVRTVPSFL